VSLYIFKVAFAGSVVPIPTLPAEFIINGLVVPILTKKPFAAGRRSPK